MTVTEAATETRFETGNIITGEILLKKKKKEECEKKKNPTCAPWILALGRGVETLAFLPVPCIPSFPIPIFPIAHPNPHCFN